MPDQRSIFMPSMDATEGPFTEVLTQPLTPSPRHINPAGRVTPAAAVMSIGTSFLEGASKGRIRAFEQEENEKLKKYSQLQEFYQRTMSDPNLTDEARTHLTQEVSKAFGGHLATASAPEKGKKGQDQSQGVGGHVKNILHDLAIGMTGGKMPKGATELGDIHTFMGKMQGELYGPENQNKFSRSHAMQGITDEIQQTATGMDPATTSLEAAQKKFAGLFQRMEVHDPQRAKSLRSDYLSPYISETSQPWIERQDRAQFSAPTPPTTSGMSVGDAPPNARSIGSAPPVAPPDQATSPALSVQAITPIQRQILARYPEWMGKSGNVEYTNAEGKPVTVEAQLVHLPGRESWYYSGNQPLPVPPGKVRAASTTAPRAERWTPDKVVKSKASETGWAYESTNLDNPDAKKRVTMGAPPPLSVTMRPQTPLDNARLEGLQADLEEKKRKANVWKALAKIEQYTKDPGEAALKGKSYMEYIRDVVLSRGGPGSWAEDKLVGPLIPEITRMINNGEIKGKGKQDVLGFLKQAAGQAQSDVHAAETAHAVHTEVGELKGAMAAQFSSIMDEINKGSGGSDYDDLDHPPANTAPPNAVAEEWTIGGQTYKKNQEVVSHGVRYRVTGVKDGKLEAIPLGK